MTQTVFDVTSDTRKAQKELDLLLAPLADVEATVEKMSKRGGLLGSLMGKPQELQRFEKSAKLLKDNLKDQLQSLRDIQQQQKAANTYEDRLRLQAAEEKLADSIRATSMEIRDLNDEFRKTGQVADEYIDRLHEIEGLSDDFGGMGMGGYGLNPLQSAAGLTGTLGQLGGGFDSPLAKFSEALQMGSQVGYELQPLADSFSGILKATKGADGILGKAKAGLSSMFSSITPMAGITLGAGAALAGVNLVLQEMQRQAEQAIEVRRRELDTLRHQIELEQQLQDLRETGDVAGAESLEKSQKKAWDEAKRVSDQAEVHLKQLWADFDEAMAGGDFFTAIRLKKDEIPEAEKVATEALSELATTIQDVGETWEALPEIDLRSRVREITEALAPLEQGPTFLEQLSEAASNKKNVIAQLDQLGEDFKNQMDELADDLAWAAQRQQAERDREDFMELRTHVESQLQLISDSREREIDITAEFGKTLEQMAKERAKAELDAQTQLNDALDELATGLADQRVEVDKEYDEAKIERVDRHERDIAKLEDDYARERKRRLEDLQAELNKAERANDVLAFIEAQERGDTDLRRMEEDHDTQMGEREAEFTLERETARKEHEQRITDMQTEAEERRTELLDTYETEKALRQTEFDERLAQEEVARDERLALEQASRDESLKAAEDAFKKQQELKEEQRAWDDEWATKEQQRQRDRQQQAYDEQRAALNAQLAEEDAIIKAGYAERDRLLQEYETKFAHTVVNTLQKGIDDATRSVAQSSTGSTGSTSSSFTPGNYADFASHLGFAGAVPGVIKEPTLSMLGERPGWGDIVIPYPNTSGADNILKALASGKSGGAQRIYNYHGSVPDGYTRAEMDTIFKRSWEALFQQLGDAVS